MKFKPETFGTLVRPRMLICSWIVPVKSTSDFISHGREHCFDSVNSNSFESYNVPILSEFQTKGISGVFGALSLGDTTVDLSTSYVGEVTHYVVSMGTSSVLANKGNIQEILKKTRRQFGSRANLRVVAVGLKFYKGMELAAQGELRPINPWEPKTTNGQEVIWFYNPNDLVPMTEIIKYEAVKKGDLIIFQKTNGMVIRKKWLNKPSFYSTSSWSCYSITLLNHTADGYTRFLPVRQFTVRRSSDPENQE